MFLRRVSDAALGIDRRLMAQPVWIRRVAVAATLVVMVAVSVPNVPRPWVDYSTLPLLNRVTQYETWGTDSLSDMYGAKVILNDPWDMFVKAHLEQTPLEAATWSKEAAAPYPPVVLLTEAALYWIGERIGVGFYGMILGLACLFVGLSARVFLETRWYLFPLLYLNFSYFSYRFVYVQDSTYLVMLTTVMAALLAARAGRRGTHLLMAVAITMKLSPLYYVKNVFGMRPRTATAFMAILAAGLLLPYFVWDNYLYIYRYGNELKGDWNDAIGALTVVIPFAVVLWYVDVRRGWDLEDRVGWGLVPFAMFLGLKMNVARHLLIVLLVPDKRGIRNVAAAGGLALPALLPSVVRFNAALPIAAAILVLGLIVELDRIGWPVIKDDWRHPGRTLRMMTRRDEQARG